MFNTELPAVQAARQQIGNHADELGAHVTHVNDVHQGVLTSSAGASSTALSSALSELSVSLQGLVGHTNEVGNHLGGSAVQFEHADESAFPKIDLNF
ncbi:MAG: hypothetical protein JWN03_4336 [Nocardia sp.]|uniref:hypothetical protein n=1 Tax=Nocardia sp. TaxID=1821 RepID=UPI002609D235|nr:hypothetical protein [Nocardia sp.]MCU1644061.1 hypothetical protein [Nocardia sp.]